MSALNHNSRQPASNQQEIAEINTEVNRKTGLPFRNLSIQLRPVMRIFPNIWSLKIIYLIVSDKSISFIKCSESDFVPWDLQASTFQTQKTDCEVLWRGGESLTFSPLKSSALVILSSTRNSVNSRYPLIFRRRWGSDRLQGWPWDVPMRSGDSTQTLFQTFPLMSDPLQTKGTQRATSAPWIMSHAVWLLCVVISLPKS